ncbi:plasmid recombination protein [Intestinimonas butyriciproducens]|uniref:MobV family relaxase n=1 Tax=Eubacteriales TaxID=186802 RepID=UPI0018AC3109|nr:MULTISPECIES: MobV family relaxase [Eubacteriales]MBU5230919.1 plasmid recombination protein [Intestinimonas butyriciproducens]
MTQKAQHAILRFAKHKAGPAGALEAHHERTKEQYASNPDIDTSRSRDNFHIIRPEQKYRREIDSRIKAAGCRTRKDSTMFVDTLITASPEFFTSRSKKEIQAYFTEAVAFMEQKVGRGNIFSAVVHMDEKTPHLHLCFTPITEDGRLSAKEILGNRAQLSKWQDEFHAHMKKAFPVLKRGESALVTKRKHIPTWLFKQSVDLTKQAATVQKVLAEITPLNAGKKRDEAAALLKRFFPRLESHLGQMKKYQATIDYLTQENEGLKEKVKDGSSIKKQLEAARLKQENEQLRRFVESIPQELLHDLRGQGRDSHSKDQQR